MQGDVTFPFRGRMSTEDGWNGGEATVTEGYKELRAAGCSGETSTPARGKRGGVALGGVGKLVDREEGGEQA